PWAAAPVPSPAEGPGLGGAPAPRREGTVQRIIRNTAMARAVKQLHNYTCQMCGLRLETPVGPYAEGAHIKPLGAPHDGPDSAGNVLCLCPNHHVLFDVGAITIADDLSLIGIDGALRTAPNHMINLEY